MRVEIVEVRSPVNEMRVGNVYPVRGGRGSRYKHMMVLIAITKGGEYRDPSALLLIIDKDGEPVGVTHYGTHYVEDLCPIAFVDGLDDLVFVMRSL